MIAKVKSMIVLLMVFLVHLSANSDMAKIEKNLPNKQTDLKQDMKILISDYEDEEGTASDAVSVLIKGNGEECEVEMDVMTPNVTRTNCLRLTNSKGIPIVCTKNKRICKTVNEVFNFMQEYFHNY